MNKVLTAVIDTPNRLLFIDAPTGATVNSVQIDGDLVNGPIVVGDQCTLTVKLPNTLETRVYNMVTGGIINKFATAR